MLSIDPVRLARRQFDRDCVRTSRYGLFEHKIQRIGSSPLALLRGSAPLFYELLERHPSLAEGPSGEGWIAGDAHLENFGAYRAAALPVGRSRPKASGSSEREEGVVFDLNDFDDAFIGPWRFDVLRLMTSLVLGGREIGADGPRTLALCDILLDAYVGSVFDHERTPATPEVVASLVDRVRRRTRKQLLDARTEVFGGRRRFVRGPRYLDLPKKLRARVDRAFDKYARDLPPAVRPPEEALEVIDAAFRVAGTGSLGSLRVGVLVRGKGGADGEWIFDIKEEMTPSAATLVRPPRLEPAERVCTAMNACLARPPRLIGTTRLRGLSMFVRRLAPQEDRLDLQMLRAADLEPLARHFGALLGAAHRRGATRAPRKPWNETDRGRLLAAAIALAGVHEAIYLAYCDLSRRRVAVRAAAPSNG